MLDALKKKLGVLPEQQKEDEMKDNQSAISAEQYEAAVAEAQTAQAELATLKASFDEQAAVMASMKEQLEAAQATLAANAEAQAKAEADAKQAKLDARMASLKAAVGDEKAAEVFEATKELNDTAFAAIRSAMETTAKAEAESPMFKEVGVETKAEANVEQKPVHFKQFIKKEAK